MNKNKTKEKKENIWKTGTIVLGSLCLILMGYMAYQSYDRYASWKGDICSEITGTPSWVDNQGNILKSGYIPIIQQSVDNETIKDNYYLALKQILVTGLINEKITFVYREGCSWCEKQIEEFKELGFWEEYENSGLTIMCN
jgi:hypothetical protein